MGTPASRNSAGLPRSVVGGAFALLGSLRRRGSALVSELQRDTGLPRTTVHRLLQQLQDVGAVERSAGHWRLGVALVDLGTAVPAEPRLRAAARRPLMELATVTGGLVALSVTMAGEDLVIEVFPGARRIAIEPQPGMAMNALTLAAEGASVGRLATVRAHEQARRGDLRPVLDAGGVDPRVSCVAAPLLLSPHDTGVVCLMLPGGAGVPAPEVAATRRTAGRIATELSRTVG